MRCSPTFRHSRWPIWKRGHQRSSFLSPRSMGPTPHHSRTLRTPPHIQRWRVIFPNRWNRPERSLGTLPRSDRRPRRRACGGNELAIYWLYIQKIWRIPRLLNHKFVCIQYGVNGFYVYLATDCALVGWALFCDSNWCRTRREIRSRILSLQDKWIAPLPHSQKRHMPRHHHWKERFWGPPDYVGRGNFLYRFTQYECMTYLEFEQIINQGKEAATRIVFFAIFLDFFLLSRTG